MRLSDAEHTGQPWRIHELTCDFVLADVRAIPARVDPMISRGWRGFALGDESLMSNPLVRALFSIRGQLAVLVRPKNRFGRLYLRGIMLFRRLIVVPALIRSIGQDLAETQAAEHNEVRMEARR